MRGYLVFLKKELFEYTKTYKLLIMVLVFVIFGITNPLVAKLTPVILKSFMTDGIIITLPEPTAYDAWMQFFKNATQMGIIVMVILFSGVLSSELSKGTLINLLTKGLSRKSVILSKYTCMVLVWTVSIALCFGLTYGYTVYLFPKEDTPNLLFSVSCLWLFGLFLLAVLLFSAALVKSSYGCLFITVIVMAACIIMNIIPSIHRYNPISLATDNMGLLVGSIEASSLYDAILVSSLFSMIFVSLSAMIFQKKQL
ncbi:MAG: ABC transporter permease [Clostridiaceae bacterium]|nr:ABC transporter permease [Clostridiaceae bacterium]